MPTIKQLPVATSVAATDVLPVSQGTVTRGLPVGSLLSTVQPAIFLAQGTLLGRVSTAAGGPEPVALGAGLAIAAGSLGATGSDHTQLPIAASSSPGDEVIVNSGGLPKRMPVTALRSLYSAGAGVVIDGSGTISVPGGPGAGLASTAAPGIVQVGSGLSVSANGTLTPDGTVVALRSALPPVALSGQYADLVGRPVLGGAASLSVGTTAGTIAAGDDARIAGALQASTAASTFQPLLGFVAYNAANPSGYISAAGAPVQSVAGRVGAVALGVADVAGAAPVASPALTGTPTGPTPALGDVSTKLSTTAFVQGALAPYLPAANSRFVNVLPFINGAADATAGLLAAVATGRNVYLPAGSYRVTNTIVLGHGQYLVGDDRTTSILTVGPDFSRTATSVIAGPGGETGPGLRDLGIAFTQTTTQASRSSFLSLAAGGTTATGIKYPPAIDFTNCARFVIDRVRISGAWDGVRATGNCGGLWISHLEVGALNAGLTFDGSLDFSHVTGYHFWPFGISGATYAGVFQDGGTMAASLGRSDGLVMTDVCTFGGRIVALSDASGFSIVNLVLDGDHSALEVQGGEVTVVGGYSTSDGSQTAPLILVDGGTVSVSGMYLWGNPATPIVSVTSGTLLLSGCRLIQNAGGQGAAVVTGGTLMLRDCYMQPGGATRTVPYVAQTGASGVLDIDGCKWDAGAGVAVSIATDAAGQRIGVGNDLGGGSLTIPGSATLGQYGVLSIARGGTGGATAAAALTALGALSATAAAATYAPLAGPVVQNLLEVTGATAVLVAQATSAGTDGKYSDIQFDPTGIQFRLVSDSYGAASNWMAVGRTGTTCTSIAFTTQAVTIGGTLTVTGALSAPTPAAGSSNNSVATTGFVAAALASGGAGSAVVPVSTVGSSGTSYTLAAASSGSNAYDITLTGNCVLSLSGGVAGQLQTISVYLRQDATAGRTPVLPSAVKWQGGAAPTPNTAAGTIDVYRFTTPDGGVTWFGSY